MSGKVKEVLVKDLSTRKVMQKVTQFSTLKDFSRIVKQTGRDCTVQRESVWRFIPDKQSKYMSALAQGYSDTSIFHLINLEKSIEILEPISLSSGVPQDLQFIDHQKLFISKGFNWVHIDGGNRSDTIMDWYDNKIALQPGNYVIPTGEGDLVRYTLNKTNYFTYEVCCEDFPALVEFIDNQTIAWIEYSGLNREERRDLFERLNDNENLNTEELRNCNTSEICTNIRELNYKYKDRFVNPNDKKTFISEKNAERYKFCAYLASLLNFYTFRGQVDAFNTKTLDSDYNSNSEAENNFKDFKKFFESIFMPLVNHMGDFTKLGGARNRLIDLYCALVEIYAEGDEVYRLDNNKLDYESYLKCYLELIGKYWGESESRFETGRSFCTFANLYGANTNYKMKHRLELIRNEFIPMLKERGIVVTKDKTRYFPQEWRRILWSRQQGKCALSGELIPITDVENGDKVHIDHIIPHSKGGQTIMENAQLALAGPNMEKSNK